MGLSGATIYSLLRDAIGESAHWRKPLNELDSLDFMGRTSNHTHRKQSLQAKSKYTHKHTHTHA